MRFLDKGIGVIDRVRIKLLFILVCGLFALVFGYEWNIGLIDRAGSGYNSIDIDSLGRPHIAYFTGAGLRYAYKDSTHWQIQNVAESCGQGLSLKLSKTGKPKISHISYSYVSQTGKLLYSYIQNDTWCHIIVDTSQSCKYSSLALDSIANPCISYLSGGNYYDDTLKVKYARLSDSIWDIQGVYYWPPTTNFFEFKSTSLEIDDMGRPHVAFGSDGFDYVNEFGYADIWYALLDDSLWINIGIYGMAGTFLIVSIDKTSLKFDSNGRPHIAFSMGHSYPFFSKYIFYSYLEPDSGWFIIRLPDTLANTPALELDSLNRAHIVYMSGNKLMYAIWNGNTWTLDTIMTGNISGDVSLELDQDDNPHVCFFSDGLYYAYGSPNGIEESEKKHLTIPDFKISPSPATNLIEITLVLPAPDKIELQLYDVKGSLIKDIFYGHKGKGIISFFWNGRDNREFKISQGIYFCRLKTKNYCITQKVIINR